jgi:hypothetical protein
VIWISGVTVVISYCLYMYSLYLVLSILPVCLMYFNFQYRHFILWMLHLLYLFVCVCVCVILVSYVLCFVFVKLLLCLCLLIFYGHVRDMSYCVLWCLWVGFLYVENFSFVSLQCIVGSRNWIKLCSSFSVVKFMDGCCWIHGKLHWRLCLCKCVSSYKIV